MPNNSSSPVLCKGSFSGTSLTLATCSPLLLVYAFSSPQSGRRSWRKRKSGGDQMDRAGQSLSICCRRHHFCWSQLGASPGMIPCHSGPASLLSSKVERHSPEQLRTTLGVAATPSVKLLWACLYSIYRRGKRGPEWCRIAPGVAATSRIVQFWAASSFI